MPRPVIWRYPVKSMAGERVTRADMTETGLVGDRIVHVYDRRGRIVTARTAPRLLQLRATLGPDRAPLVDGLPWDSPDVAERVEAAVGPGDRTRLIQTSIAELLLDAIRMHTGVAWRRDASDRALGASRAG